MSEQIKIHINIRDGELNIEASTDSLENIFSKLETFVPQLTQSYQQCSSIDDKNDPSENTSEQAQADKSDVDHQNDKTEEETRPKKRRSSSSKGESYDSIDIGLSTDQRQQLRSFYQQKNPQGQSQQILVVMYWLSKNTDVQEFTDDVIFTGLKTVDERIPKRIGAVLSNLKNDAKITGSKGKFKINHIGEDFVERDM